MNEQTVIEQIAAAVVSHLPPQTPIDKQLWDLESIGRHLRRKSETVRTGVVCKPDFPKAIRLPSDVGRKSQPLWKAIEVIEWAEKYQEKN